MMIESLDLVAGKLKAMDCITILTHANPDGDTLGSGIALCLALRSMGKKANISNSKEIPSKYDFVTKYCDKQDFEEQTVISVDVAEESLLGDENEEKYHGKIALAIDHHRTNSLFAADTYVESDSASCCEIIFNLLKVMGVQITKEIADCLFLGCSTDTGCFRYSNVTPRTHRIAAELIECGAGSAKINELMFDTTSFARLKLQQLCLDKLELFFGGRMSLFIIDREMAEEAGCGEEDFNSIVSLARQIEGVELGVTLKEKDDGVIKASFRSGETVDSSELAHKFGGGGHIRAAGCSFDCSMEEVKQLILAEAEKIFAS